MTPKLVANKKELQSQRVPHTLPLWNEVPKTKIGMVFWCLTP